MKKIFATLIVICFIMLGGSNVYALTPTDLGAEHNNRYYVSEVQDVSKVKFDEIVDFLETHAKAHFSITGEKITWAICSLNNHRNLQFCIFYDKDTDAYGELISCIDDSVDFIQFGTLQYNEFLDNTKEAFEEDSVNAALNAIIPINTSLKTYQTGSGEKIFPCWRLNEDKGKIYEEIKSHHIPIYWNIKEADGLGIHTLEVAIGKYVIKPGDTLSEIAMKYPVTMGRLLYKNSNITNPDLIYAGDYLVIR